MRHDLKKPSEEQRAAMRRLLLTSSRREKIRAIILRTTDPGALEVMMYLAWYLDVTQAIDVLQYGQSNGDEWVRYRANWVAALHDEPAVKALALDWDHAAPPTEEGSIHLGLLQ